MNTRIEIIPMPSGKFRAQLRMNDGTIDAISGRWDTQHEANRGLLKWKSEVKAADIKFCPPKAEKSLDDPEAGDEEEEPEEETPDTTDADDENLHAQGNGDEDADDDDEDDDDDEEDDDDDDDDDEEDDDDDEEDDEPEMAEDDDPEAEVHTVESLIDEHTRAELVALADDDDIEIGAKDSKPVIAAALIEAWAKTSDEEE